MNPRAPETRLRHPLEQRHRRHRAALVWRHALRGAERCVVAIAIAVLLGVALSPGVTLAWMRSAALAAVGGIAIAMAARRFRREDLRLEPWLERVEARFPALRSWIRNAVDFERQVPQDVSPALAQALKAEAGRRLEEAPLEELRPRVAPRRPTLVMAAALALMVAAGLVWPARTQRSWATLWNPEAAAPPVRLEVEPGSVTLTPGASLAVRTRVWGSDRAPKLEIKPGTSATAVAESREEGGARVWRFDLVQLTRSHDYRVKLAAAESPLYRISLSGSLAPVSFEVEYRAPAYARLPAQRGTSARGDLSALRGTEATLVVTFDRDLAGLEARLPAGGSRRWQAITPRRWRGTIPVDRDGEYELVAEARADEAEASPGPRRFRYRVTALADAPPVLMVQVPQADVDLPTGQQIPLDVLAQDDLGLTELTLQVRRDPEGGWSDLPLARFASRPRDARVETRWDASGLGLLPGQTASFRMVLFDDNAVSGRGRAVSPIFELRFPSLADLYDRVDERQETAARALEKVADQARELQKTLDKLARQAPRQESAPSASFERSEELRSAMQRQLELGKQLDQATEGLRRSAEEAAERQAFDQELMSKVRQVNELLEQIQSPEFKDALKKMQQAMENLDRRALERQMPEWREQSKQMVENLERTLELLKKLREEEKLQALAQRAQELKAQQDALNREHQESSASEQAPKNPELAERQERAAKESEELAKDVAEQSKSQGDESSGEMQKASEELSQQAAPSQREAAQSSGEGKNQQAQQAGQKASEALQSAAERMQSMVSEQQQQQEQLDLAALRRSAQDLVSLQRANDANLSSSAPPGTKADRQTDLSEGASRVADSLFQLSRQTPFLSPRLAEALGRAINGLGESGKDMANGNRARGEATGRQAGQSLNAAILELRSAESAMCNKPGPGQGGRIDPRRIGSVGEQQSQLNQRTQRLAQKLSEQMRLSSGDREQLERLAGEQARIRSQLEQIRAEEESKRELLGRLDQTEREMKEVEEVLRQGSVDGTLEEKQQRILSRLLDAQRSVNRRDYDPQRESRSGEDLVRRSPAELPAELMRGTDRFRQDLLKSELDRYPAQYRSFVEAYLRLLNGSRR